jgi:cell division protein FtsQ
MLKRINWKAIGIGFLWVISLSGLIVLMSFIEHEKSAQQCTDVKVYIPGNQTFVNRQEIDRILWSVGGQLKGKDLTTINTQNLEDAIKMNAFIRTAKVYADMNGVIRVRIEQREPVLRVINIKNQDFYIDQDGMKIPVSPNFTAQVLVANGNITEDLESKVRGLRTPMAKDLFKLAKFIQQDTLWSEQIEQIYVNANSEIQLVPRVGDHQIIIGDADSLERKFKNLLLFYKKAMPKVGWNTYKTINVKYLNQIICKKSGIAPDTLSRAIVVADSTKTDTLKTVQATVKN